MCFVFIWEQTATCATYSINWLDFITEIKSVYSAVRIGALYKAGLRFVFKGLIPGFLLVLQFMESAVTALQPVNVSVTPTQLLAVNQILLSMLAKLRHNHMTRKIIVNMLCAWQQWRSKWLLVINPMQTNSIVLPGNLYSLGQNNVLFPGNLWKSVWELNNAVSIFCLSLDLNLWV